MKPKIKHLSDIELLKILKRLKPNERNSLFKFINDDGVNVVCECINNILFNKHIGLKKNQKKKLNKELQMVQKQMTILGKSLSKDQSNNSIKRRRNLLSQHGGFLSTILSIAIPLLTELLFRKK